MSPKPFNIGARYWGRTCKSLLIISAPSRNALTGALRRCLLCAALFCTLRDGVEMAHRLTGHQGDRGNLTEHKVLYFLQPKRSKMRYISAPRVSPIFVAC